jgi:large subunit ribosomal protein L9
VKVILRNDLPELGKRGDIIEVSDGYARNFLFPRGAAMVATKGAVDQAASMRRSRDVRDARDRGAAEEVARQLVPKVITLTARAGAEGKLFGSITAPDIAEAVNAQPASSSTAAACTSTTRSARSAPTGSWCASTPRSSSPSPSRSSPASPAAASTSRPPGGVTLDSRAPAATGVLHNPSGAIPRQCTGLRP